MDRWRKATAAAVVGLVLHALCWWPYWIDDAFITFRYVQNFASGRGMVYNEGESVEGITNLGWALWLTPFAGGDLLWWAKVWGLAFGVGAVVLVGEWCRAQALPLSATTVALAALVVPPWLASHTMYGLEGAAAAFFVTLAWSRHGAEADGRSRAPWSAIGMALAPWVRPDGALAAIVVGAWHVVRRGRKFTRAAAIAVGVVLLGAGVLVALKLHWFGDVLPNTAHTKLRSWPPARGLVYLQSFLSWPSPAFSWSLVAAMGWGALRTVRRDDRALPGVFALVAFGAAVAQDGDFMENFRFFVPAWPAVAAALGVLVADLGRLHRHLPVVAAVAAAATMAPLVRVLQADRLEDAGFAAWARTKPWPPYADGPLGASHWDFMPHFAFPAAWSVVQRAEGASLAYVNIGLVGAVSDGPVLDLLGLTDPIMANRFSRKDWAVAWAHVQAEADYVMMDVPAGEWSRYRGPLAEAGWPLVDGCSGYWVFANPARSTLAAPARPVLRARLDEAFVRLRSHPAALIAIGYELAFNPGDPELFFEWEAKISPHVSAMQLRQLRCESGLDGCFYKPSCDNGQPRMSVAAFADPATWPGAQTLGKKVMGQDHK